MFKYRIKFSVDNSATTETIISAQTEMAAKKLIEAQYSGHKITFWSVIRIYD